VRPELGEVQAVDRPVAVLRDWSKATIRGLSDPSAKPQVQELSQLLSDLRAVSAIEPTGAFVGLVEKVEGLQKMLSDSQ